MNSDPSARLAELVRIASAEPPQYWRALDFARLVEETPPPPRYFRTVYRMPCDAGSAGHRRIAPPC